MSNFRNKDKNAPTEQQLLFNSRLYSEIVDSLAVPTRDFGALFGREEPVKPKKAREVGDDGEDEEEEEEKEDDLAYGLFNSGEVSPNQADQIALSPHPHDLMENKTFDERAAGYEETIIEQQLYKRLLRLGHGARLRETDLKDLAIEFHCNIFIPGQKEPVVTTYGFNNPPTVAVPKLVRGLVYAIGTMHLSEVSEFLIKSNLMFGQLGNCRIPAHTDVIVIIDIRDVATNPGYKYTNFMPPHMRENIDPKDALIFAQATFAEAKQMMRREEYREAIIQLNRALFYIEKVPRPEEKTKWHPHQMLHCSINMTLGKCFFQLREYYRVVRLLMAMRKYMPHDIYAVYYMEACAHEQLGSDKIALAAFKQAYKIFRSKECWEAIQRLVQKVDIEQLNKY